MSETALTKQAFELLDTLALRPVITEALMDKENPYPYYAISRYEAEDLFKKVIGKMIGESEIPKGEPRLLAIGKRDDEFVVYKVPLASTYNKAALDATYAIGNAFGILATHKTAGDSSAVAIQGLRTAIKNIVGNTSANSLERMNAINAFWESRDKEMGADQILAKVRKVLAEPSPESSVSAKVGRTSIKPEDIKKTGIRSY